jgi:hypothetical protein
MELVLNETQKAAVSNFILSQISEVDLRKAAESEFTSMTKNPGWEQSDNSPITLLLRNNMKSIILDRMISLTNTDPYKSKIESYCDIVLSKVLDKINTSLSINATIDGISENIITYIKRATSTVISDVAEREMSSDDQEYFEDNEEETREEDSFSNVIQTKGWGE